MSGSSKSTRQQADPPRVPRDGRPVAFYIGWSILGGAWLLLMAAMVSYDPRDLPNHAMGLVNARPHNWVGRVGATLAYHVYLMLGEGVWLPLAGVAVLLGAAVVGRKINQWGLRGLGLILMAVAVSAVIALVGPTSFAAVAGMPDAPGGLLALFVNDQLVSRFNLPGTMVILAVAFWIGAILTADRLVLAIPRALGEMLLRMMDIKLPKPRLPRFERLSGFLAQSWAALRAHRPAFLSANAGLSGPARSGGRRSERKSGPRKSTPAPDRRRRARQDDAIDEDAGEMVATDEDAGESCESDVSREQSSEATPIQAELASAAASDEHEHDDAADRAADDDADAPAAYVNDAQDFTPDELRAKMQKLPINFAPRVDTGGNEPPREADYSGYQFPAMDQLEEPEGDFTQEQEAICREQAMSLEQALQEYKIDGEVVGIDSGPVITLFEVRLAAGTKVSSINSVDSDLARALKAQNIRIVPNMAGKDTVGIEVPNLKKERVRLKELMTASPTAFEKMRLPMFLGKDASGNPLVQDLSAMPHMLIAGTTGSGKSVCMNSIIMSFLFTRKPDELKLVLVDPKMVEMSLFKDIPHLMCPVVTEMGKAAAILEWAVTKMDERYELLAEAGVRDIGGYNDLGAEGLRERLEPASEEEFARVPKKLPYMVFVIDELADLMMTNKEVEGSIVRIAQKARAVGIHLILATQRPQANVVTGLIKSNMPCRIAMKVSSGMDSRIVLDQKGGELLLGHGDMLFLSPRSSKLTRAQGSLVDDGEIRKTVKFLKNVAQQNFEPQLVQMKNDGGGGELDEEKDEYFDDAVEVVLETQRGSVSLLQRRLTVGYSRASRLIEQMAQAGIIGDYKGSQAREVLIGADEWEAMKAQAAADAAAADGVEVNGAEPLDGDDDPSFDENEDADAAPAELAGEYRQ